MSTLTPDWVQDAIFYQIFPDRFAKSARVEKPHNLEAWDTPPTTLGFKGGDLLGVLEHLDYLLDLGITAIYFTPVFQSTANHRYHTQDYFQIDPVLGANEAFRELLVAAHGRGLRVVLDGVFNHASRGFYYFNHALENGSASPYLDWFTFRDFPVRAYDGPPNYDAWWGLGALPKLNTRNPQVREYIFRVADYWIRQGIDGWRLDVPNEIDDDEFWREFRRRVKAANPDAYIVGEIWHRADRWLQGDQFDAVMNYQFTRACICFCINLDSSGLELVSSSSYGDVRSWDAPEFMRTLGDLLTWYPREIGFAQMNLLDSHDTARFLSIAHGDASALKLAWLAMFTYPGAPTIYYGDEIGMEGRRDPDSRRTFVWDATKWNRDLVDEAKRLVALRKKYVALRRGTFISLYAAGQVCAYARQFENETLIVALNAGSTEAAIGLDLSGLGNFSRLTEEWTGAQTALNGGSVGGLKVPPRRGLVWSAQ
ncbi:MAG TPA: glycoside hydrolase family 13 protein [Anaerolineae bacterium]